MTFNILIVDDSFSMRSVIRKIISLSGFQVNQYYEAQNGREALEVLSGTGRCDHLGYQYARNERDRVHKAPQAGQSLQRDTVIFVTTEGSKERIEEAQSAGADGFLKKPFLPEELRKLICELVGLSDDGKYGEENAESDSLDF